MNDDLKKLLKTLPPIFGRTAVKELLGDTISAGHLANLDSRGEGPPKVRIGPRKVGYVRESFVAWLEARSKANCTPVPEPGTLRKGAK